MHSINSSSHQESKPRASKEHKKRGSEAKKLFKSISEDEVAQSPFFKPENATFDTPFPEQNSEEVKQDSNIAKPKPLSKSKYPEQVSFNRSDKVISEVSFDGREKSISFKNLKEDIFSSKYESKRVIRGPDIESK